MYLNREILNKMVCEELERSDVESMIKNKFDGQFNSKKSDINNMIDSKISTCLKSKDFQKSVKELAAEVVNEIFRILWQRNTFWKSAASN